MISNNTSKSRLQETTKKRNSNKAETEFKSETNFKGKYITPTIRL